MKKHPQPQTTFADSSSRISAIRRLNPQLIAQLQPLWRMKRKFSSVLIIAIACVHTMSSLAQSSCNIITTIAGTGVFGSSGDGGPATAACISPYGLAQDGSGNIFVSDMSGSKIRMINRTGVITTVAGTGAFGYSGDGGPATAASLGMPTGMAIDNAGNLYFSDISHNVVRKITTSGIILTVAGNDTAGFSGDGGPATAAMLYWPSAVTVDTAGNILICDELNYRVRMVNTSGIISTIAGTGASYSTGDGGPATAASFEVDGIAVDAHGRIFLSDINGNSVRVISTTGIISSFAGNGIHGFAGDGGPATAAEIDWPDGLTFDRAGNLYLCDHENNRIRKISVSGVINTIAGNGLDTFGGDGGAATAAALRDPTQVILDSSGTIYIADWENYRVRKITPCAELVSGPGSGGRQINFYPNPTHDIIHISQCEYIKAIVTSIDGKKMVDKTATEDIDISDLPTGFYFVLLYNKEGGVMQVEKILKK